MRESKNLSQEQLSKKLGYSVQYIHQMESGTRRLTAKMVQFIGKTSENT